MKGVSEGDTYELILQKSASLFRLQGYHGTSMQEIAEAVGIEKASLYYHFPGKHTILQHIITRGMAGLGEPLGRILAADIPADEKLRRYVIHHITTQAGNMDQSAVLMLDMRKLPPQLQGRFTPRQRNYFKGISQIIQEGVRQGIFQSETPDLDAWAVLGMCSWPVLWYDPQGPLSAEAIGERFADIILGGLKQKHRSDSS